MQGLQRAGFTVTQRFANRTIVDATAPSSTVEGFFATEMHTVQQGKYGTRFANLKPATVPASIASYASANGFFHNSGSLTTACRLAV